MQRLTDEQLQFYKANGYLVIRNLLPDQDIETYLTRLDDIITGKVPAADKMLVMKDIMVAKGRVKTDRPQEAIAKLQDFNFDPVLAGYLTQPDILDYVENFCGPNVKTIHNMLINKPPNVDGRHPLHQDLLYFPFRPADKIVATWTALEHVNRQNGCLAVIPGSHLAGELYEHGMPEDAKNINLAYFGVKDLEVDNRTHLEMDPGDVVFFHPLLIHGSGQNRSQGFRRAISSHYAACECTYNENGRQMAAIRHYQLVRGKEVDGGL